MPKKNPASLPAASTTPLAAETPALTPAASAVLSLLNAHDGTTAANLAERTGLGRSTVTKALAALHDAGLAVRREGGHEGARRVADRWFAAPGQAAAAAAAEDEDVAADAPDLTEPATVPGGTDDDSPADTVSKTGPDDAADEPSAAVPEAEATGEHIEKDEPSQGQPKEAAEAANESGDMLDTAESTGDAALDATPEDDAVITEPAETVTAEPGGAGPDETDETAPKAREVTADPNSEHAKEATDPTDTDGDGASDGDTDPQPEGADAGGPGHPADDGRTAPEPTAAAKASGPRLGKGELREMVEAHLRAHPNQSFTSTQLHHIFNRSSGAIANACETLVKEGKAFVALEKKPRRFQWNTAAASETV